MNEITIENIGPIRQVRIPIDESGGITVLRARNGKGKSKAIETVESLTGRKTSIEVRDGQLRGEANGLGVTLRVGRSVRRSGELEWEILDGTLSPELLVNPGLKSPEAADAVRIKALVQLAGVQPDPALFYRLVGGREVFESLISTAAIASDDLVVMAERVKRDLEVAARGAESKRDHAEGRARGARDAASGVDATVEHDQATLATRLELAIRTETALQQESKVAADKYQQNQQARKALQDAEARYSGPNSDDASVTLTEYRQALEVANQNVARLMAELAAAKQIVKEREQEVRHASQMLEAAKQHERVVSSWRDVLDRPVPQLVAPEALGRAAREVAEARQAVEQGAVIRKALEHLRVAEQAAAEARQYGQEAEQLRTAARSTDDILSDAVARTGAPLRVEAGRMVLDTDRGVTYFADLSAGERRRIALDVAIRKVGKPGILPLSQEAWEGLDEINRREIAEQLKGTGVVILTAECSTDEEIRAEVYEPAA